MRACKTAALLLLTAHLAAQNAYSQDSSKDGILSPDFPSMPSVAAPSIGQSFYTPGTPDFYTGAESLKQNTTVREKSASEKTESTQKTDTKKTSSSAAKKITATDLLSLKSSGLLEILDTNYRSQNDAETKVLLERVLDNIETIKEDSKTAQKTETNATVQHPATVAVPSQTAASTQSPVPHILRFTVNGYNILSTCRRIFISDVQPNGAFLVTGDRRYTSDKKMREETFHILFKTAPGENGITNYSAAAVVSQDYENKYSFLYQLSQRKDLKAVRVGNLVTMRTEDPDWKMEFLIDIGQ